MFWIYILQCADGSYYTGHTDNLEKRIREHDFGTFECYTKTRLPIKLVYQQACQTREECLRAEQRVKGWSRAKKAAMVRGDWAEVSRLARNKSTALRQAQGERNC
jgi:putative endonuclease